MDKAQKYYESKIKKELLKEMDDYAMWSFGIAISPVFFWWVFLIPYVNFLAMAVSVPLFLFSLFLGIMSLVKTNSDKKMKGTGFAITGIAISIIYLITIGIVVFMILTMPNYI